MTGAGHAPARGFQGRAIGLLAACLALAASAAEARQQVADHGEADLATARVPAGKYYVGRVTGQRDYQALANATTPGFLVLRGEVTQGLFGAMTAWGILHGYSFGDSCKDCDRSHDAAPVAGVTWRDAALLANALSERDGLDAVYRDAAGQPVRDAKTMDRAVIEPTLSGYRLPTIPEWQIALRGADKGLADNSYGTPGRSPNALGLTDTAGPLAEWTASSMDTGEVRKNLFACNEARNGVIEWSNCSARPSTAADPDLGFRLVRKLPK